MTRNRKVLFIHPSGAFGGASKSLIELYKVLSRYSVYGTVLCPVGSAGKAFHDVGLKLVQIKGLAQWDNTRYGYYRNFRWLILLREISLFPFTWIALRKLLKNHSFDIVHLNEVTLLPWAYLIRRWAGVPVIVHVRSLQRGASEDFRTRWFNKALLRDVDKIIVIDESVRSTLPQWMPVSVVHNGLKVEPALNHNDSDVFHVGLVGGLLKLKGVYEFIEAARILVKERNLNIEFTIVGENSRSLSGWKGWLLSKFDLAHDVRADLEHFIQSHGLSEHVRLTGFVRDVKEVYSSLNVLCFPSHLDAAGRPVFEAAFYGVPSIVAVRNPKADTIVDGETGLCIDHSDSDLLADAIEKLYNDPLLLSRLGKNARALAAQNFDIEKNAEKLMFLYSEVIEQRHSD